ncbi:MAG: pyridoxamine 5'-phosphate oxidase family protein [Myxococcaceae bacterium]
MDKTQAVERVRSLIGRFRVAMMTTVDGGGVLRSRPMVVQDIDDDGNLWFFTSKSTEKVQDAIKDSRVSVAFVDERRELFVSLSGEAEIIDDAEREHQLWTPELRAWFPDGVDAPDLVLVKVRVEHVEAWDSPKSTMVQVTRFVRAAVTGTPAWGGHHEVLDIPAP